MPAINDLWFEYLTAVLAGTLPPSGSGGGTQLNGRVTLTNTTASDVIAAQGAGKQIAVMSILVVNADAIDATRVEIRDGTTVKIQGLAHTNGAGFAHSGGSQPLFITTANTAVTARCVTTAADVDVFVSGFLIQP